MKSKMQLIYLYESVEQVELAFYEAFGTGDFYMMESLFADEGVSCTHPNSPTIIGRDKVIENWEFVLKDIPQTIIDRKVLNVSKSNSIEVRQVIESYDLNNFTGKKSEVYTTNVYVLQENGWRLQTQHASLSKVNTPYPKESSTVLEFMTPATSLAIN